MSTRAGAWANPEHEAMLRALWPKGLSARQIAEQINAAFDDAGYSRNAVIGKAGRLGLGGRAEASPPARRPHSETPRAPSLPGARKPATVALTVAAKPQPPRVFPVADEPPPKSHDLKPTTDLIGLAAHMCRWPIGDPQHPDFGFCGRHAEGSYCETHSRRAWASPTLRKHVDSRLLAPIPMRRRA